MARDDHQLKFRVPEGLRQRIEDSAQANKRSLNAEIVAALEEKYPDESPVTKLLEMVEHELSTKEGEDERQAFLKKLIALMEGEIAKRQ